MKKVYCVYEDSHGMIGVAKDYPSAIKNLIKEKWVDNSTKMLDVYGNPSTVIEVFGSDWEKYLLYWGVEAFNISFDGLFYIYPMEVWES